MSHALKRVLAIVVIGVAAHAALPASVAARTITINETANLDLTQDGKWLKGSGTATGTLPGRVSGRFEVNGLTVSGSVTLSPKGGGSLTINVRASLKSREGGVETLKGIMAVRRGTGRFANAAGGGDVTAKIRRGQKITASVIAHGVRLTY